MSLKALRSRARTSDQRVGSGGPISITGVLELVPKGKPNRAFEEFRNALASDHLDQPVMTPLLLARNIFLQRSAS